MTEVAMSYVPAAAGTHTEMEWEPLRRFLWQQSFVSSPSEGFLAALTNDLRKEVWSHIVDDRTFARASQVNKKWKQEMECAWRTSAENRNILKELEFWEERGKDWKWVLKCKTNALKEEDAKEGCGICQEANGNYEGEWKTI